MPAQLNALCQIPRLHLVWNTVKAKGAVGGIDGISVDAFEKDKRRQIPLLAEELKAGTWKPQPYLEIEVAKTKNPDEMRKLGMTAIRNKIVVTYDIGDDKRRAKVVKLLEGIGTRMNFSVFECMLTDIQYRNMCNRLAKIIVKREDWVNIYPLCTECYARITYIPDIKKKEPVKIVVI